MPKVYIGVRHGDEFDSLDEMLAKTTSDFNA